MPCHTKVSFGCSGPLLHHFNFILFRNMEGKQVGALGLVGVMLIGGVFFLSALSGIWKSYSLEKSGIPSQGRIFKIEHVSNSDTDALVFWLAYRYRNTEYVTHNRIMDSDSLYAVNEIVPIRIDASAPEEAIIDSKKEKYTGYVLPAAVGGIIIMGGVLLLLGMYKSSIK